MTKRELRRALCADADGDLEHCRQCQQKCLIGRRLLDIPPRKQYTTVGVPQPLITKAPRDAPALSVTHQMSTQHNTECRDAWNQRHRQAASERVWRGIEALRRGGTPDEAVREAEYSSWQCFRTAAKNLGLLDELPDLSNAAKTANAKERACAAVKALLAGADPTEVAAKYGCSSVDAMNRMLRKHKKEFAAMGFGNDISFTAHGIERNGNHAETLHDQATKPAGLQPQAGGENR